MERVEILRAKTAGAGFEEIRSLDHPSSDLTERSLKRQLRRATFFFAPHSHSVSPVRRAPSFKREISL
jgi:hypothetical protein